MNRNLFVNIPHGQPEKPVVKVELQDDPNKQVFDEIFKVDPFTGLPRNSQQVFLSDDTDPMIKNFIATVLKGEDIPRDSTFSSLDDDTISELTINHGESRVDYISRVTKYLDSQKEFLLKSQEKEVIK